MNATELVQRIGDDVCEGCGPDPDCGIDPEECERIDCAIAVLEEYLEKRLEELGYLHD